MLIRVLFSLASIGVFAAAAGAEDVIERKVGEHVAIVFETPLLIDGKEVTKLKVGTTAVIKEVADDRVLLKHEPSGWADRRDVCSLGAAELVFLDRLNEKPSDASRWKPLAAVRKERRRLLLEEIAKLPPALARAVPPAAVPVVTEDYKLILQAYELRTAEKFDEALKVLNEALKLNPKNHQVFYSRGKVWEYQGDGLKAIRAYSQYIERVPDDPDGYNARAWVRATIPDANVRDGKKAVQDALVSARLDEWDNAASLDTLAASYAEAGDFERAVAWQKAAIDAAPASSLKNYRQRLKLYQQGKPFRLDVPSPGA